MIDLHISIDDKSVVGTCSVLRQYFEEKNNPIIIIGKRYGYDYSSFSNLEQLPKTFRAYIQLYKKMKAADRIHLHGFFDFPLIFLIACNGKIASKCNWFIWGQDLYGFVFPPSSIISRLICLMRKIAIKKIKYVSTNVAGDYRLLEKIMAKKYCFFKLAFFPNSISNVYQYDKQNDDRTTNILLGNSATQTNCHFEAIDKLYTYRDQNLKIFVPLSYGDFNYREKVIKYGRERFGDRFIPITNFMPRGEYDKFLSTIDIAVFANNRQQAMGNIFPLLYAGTKVFIKNNITTWECLHDENHLDIFDFDEIGKVNFVSFIAPVSDVKEQKRKIEAMINEELFVNSFKALLISEE